MYGKPIEGECTCFISPPCHFCVSRVWVIVDPETDEFMFGPDMFTENFDDAIKYGDKEEAERYCPSDCDVVAYDNGGY